MKTCSIFSKIILIMFASTSFPGYAATTYEWAYVRNVVPILGQQCSSVNLSRETPSTSANSQPDITESILRGLIIGVFNSSSTQREDTRTLSVRNTTEAPLIRANLNAKQTTECVVSNPTQPLTVIGYHVALNHRGNNIVFKMSNRPQSSRIRVQVQITPMPLLQ